MKCKMCDSETGSDRRQTCSPKCDIESVTHGLIGKTIVCEHGSGVMNSDGVATLNTTRRPRLTRDGRTQAEAGYGR